MLTELPKLGQARGAVAVPPTRLKTQKPSLKSPLGRVAATRLARKALPDHLTNVGQERSVDTSYRAEVSLSHLTHWRAAAFCDFCDGPMARALFVAKTNHGFLGFMERAIGALREVQS